MLFFNYIFYMEEIYKTINNYPNYAISNLGNVKNKKTNKLLKIRIDKEYNRVRLYNSYGAKNHSVHRLVGEHFLLNPFNKPEINHKDGNKLNNHLSNLEWNTKSENQTHRRKILKQGVKPIKLIKDGLIYSFDSISECARNLNLDGSGLSRLLNGKSKSYLGYKVVNKKEV